MATISDKDLDMPIKESNLRTDSVDHPPHYIKGGIEAIDVIEAWELPFCLGNTIKYLCRLGWKNEDWSAEQVLIDLKKARWYLNREIQKLESSVEEE